jgi:hypothetical protein
VHANRERAAQCVPPQQQCNPGTTVSDITNLVACHPPVCASQRHKRLALRSFLQPPSNPHTLLHSHVQGQLDAVHSNSDAGSEHLELQLRFSFPQWAIELAGAPETMWVMVKSAGESLQVCQPWSTINSIPHNRAHIIDGCLSKLREVSRTYFLPAELLSNLSAHIHFVCAPSLHLA